MTNNYSILGHSILWKNPLSAFKFMEMKLDFKILCEYCEFRIMCEIW